MRVEVEGVEHSQYLGEGSSAGLALHLLSDFNVHIDSVCSNAMILHNFG